MFLVGIKYLFNGNCKTSKECDLFFIKKTPLSFTK